MPDEYTRRARLAPAGLAALPAAGLITGGLITPDEADSIAAYAFGGVGLLVAAFTRERGSRLQPGLWRSWGGSPTLRRLRWKDADPVMMKRRHELIGRAVREPLPTEDDERTDRDAADRRYEAVTSVLRERTRDKDAFAPLFDENSEYGFRRNCLGIRPFALLIAGLVLAASLILLLVSSENESRYWIGLAIGAIALPAWWFIVKPSWVRKSAERYADRLIEAGEALGALRPTSRSTGSPP